MKRFKNAAVVVGSLAVAAAAHAEGVDTATVTAGITEAGAAILAVLGALTALSVSIFGVSKVYAFVKRKAGA